MLEFVGQFIEQHAVAVVAAAGGFLVGCGRYRESRAKAGAVESRATTTAVAVERQEDRADAETAALAWKAIAEQKTAELTAYAEKVHAERGKAQDVILGLLKERGDLAAQVAGLSVRVQSCEDDRADLRDKVTALEAGRSEDSKKIADLEARMAQIITQMETAKHEA